MFWRFLLPVAQGHYLRSMHNEFKYSIKVKHLVIPARKLWLGHRTIVQQKWFFGEIFFYLNSVRVCKDEYIINIAHCVKYMLENKVDVHVHICQVPIILEPTVCHIFPEWETIIPHQKPVSTIKKNHLYRPFKFIRELQMMVLIKVDTNKVKSFVWHQ